MIFGKFSETSELSGFDEFATVPITFPIDICLMEVANRLYAACLSLEYHGGKNVTVFSILAHGVNIQAKDNQIVLKLS